jgi:hypothetical protein
LNEICDFLGTKTEGPKPNVKKRRPERVLNENEKV